MQKALRHQTLYPLRSVVITVVVLSPSFLFVSFAPFVVKVVLSVCQVRLSLCSLCPLW